MTMTPRSVRSERAVALEERVDALLAALSEDDRTAITLADWSPLTDRGLPFPHYVDSGSGLRGVDGATAFPVGLALAATFDAELARTYAGAVASEARRAGFTCVLGPTLDLARDPRGGRITEAFGEDPWLSGHLGAGHVGGVQAQHVMAQVKHFIAYTSEERRTGHGPVWDRGDAADVAVSRGTLDAVYLRPFRAAVDAGAWSLMGSYNRLGGRYVCQSGELLAIPRDEWGWRGFYAPDFIFAVRDPEAALAAGLDVPGLEGSAGRTAEMVAAAGPDARDDIVRRILRALVGSGLVDDPPSAPEPGPVSNQHHLAIAHRTVVSSIVLLRNKGTLPFGPSVRSVAVIGAAGQDAMYTSGGSSAVSLTRERIVSPLDALRARGGTGTVVTHAQGSWGDVPLPAVPASCFSLPDGSAPGVLVTRQMADGSTSEELRAGIDHVLSADDIRDALPVRWQTRLTADATGSHRLSLDIGGRAVVRVAGIEVMAGSREASPFIAGPAYPLQCVVDLIAGEPVALEVEYEVGSGLVEPGFGLLPKLSLGWQPPDGLLDEAVALARESDAAVIVVNATSGEGMDRSSLGLPGDQDRLVATVAAANPRTVVVLNTPGAVTMPWLDEVDAVLQVWYPGEQFGPALAAVLFGDAGPGGRLPVTFPHNVAHLPGGYRTPGESPTTVSFDEGDRIGYRAAGVREHGPLFPFGYGLSYSTTGHEVLGATRGPDGLVVALRLTNHGDLSAVHVAQAYVAPRDDSSDRRLCGVARAELAPRASLETTLTIAPRDLALAGAPLERVLVIATDATAPGERVDEPEDAS